MLTTPRPLLILRTRPNGLLRKTTKLPLPILRPLSYSPHLFYASGDTGSVRSGGEAAGDSWTRREKAAENVYIKQKEQNLLTMLREKIAAQEAILAKDRAILAAMEDQYGHVVEEKAGVDKNKRDYQSSN
ncbi:ATPase inhibitor [Cercospora zeina]